MELSNEVLDQIVPFSGIPQTAEKSMSMIEQGQSLQQTKTSYTTAVSVQRPRQIAKIASNVISESKLAGSSFYYRWEVFDKGKGRKVPIQGPSIDLAMCIARNYGNCVLDVDAVETPTHYMMKGIFIDLETGFTCPRLFRQRKGQNISGKMDADRQEDIVFQIGQSKAIRNAIVKAMPSWLIEKAIETAQQAELASIKPENIALSRSRVIDFFSQYGVTAEDIETQRGRKADEWTAQDIVDLRGTATAIKEGRINAGEIFKKPEVGTPENTSQTEPAETKPDETQPDPEKETAEKPDEKPPEDPSVEMALRWCKENEPIGRYFKGKPPLRNVEIAAAALGIEFGEKDLPRVVHTQIRKRMQEANSLNEQAAEDMKAGGDDPGYGHKSGPQEGEVVNAEFDSAGTYLGDHSLVESKDTDEQQQIDQQQKLFGLMNYYNEATVKCETVPGFKALFRMATAYAGMSPGSRPNGIEQAEKFQNKLEELSLEGNTIVDNDPLGVNDEKTDSETSIPKDLQVEEKDPAQILNNLATYMGINHPNIDLHRFKNFIGLRANQAGVPSEYIAEKFMTDNVYENQMLEHYENWEKSF